MSFKLLFLVQLASSNGNQLQKNKCRTQNFGIFQCALTRELFTKEIFEDEDEQQRGKAPGSA